MEITLNIDEREIELAKFFKLAENLPYMLKMFSPYIDNHWHRISEDQEEFRLKFEIPENTSILHLAGGSDIPEHIEWVSAYEASFGALPKIWFYDAMGIVDEIAYQDYVHTGEVYSSWDCGPATVKPDKFNR